MGITTKGGDKGQTSLIGGERVSKAHARVESYGDVDELSSCLGWALAELTTARNENRRDDWKKLEGDLVQIQRHLFALAADLASPQLPEPRITTEQVQFLERNIDELSSNLPPQCCFILPGGSRIAAALHLARTICRRAERHAVAVAESEAVNSQAIIYLNRLSDWLFLAARWSNFLLGVEERQAY